MSLRLLDALSLFPLVFYIPPTVVSTLSSQPSSASLAIVAATILQTFLQPDAALFPHPPVHPLILSGLSSSTSVVSRLYMACALTPYRGITYVEKKKERPALEAVIREGLKVGTKNHYLDGIPALFLASELLKSADIDDDKFRTPSERVAIGVCRSPLSFHIAEVLVQGLLLRDNLVHNALIGAHWTTSLLFALIQELVDCYDASKDDFNGMDYPRLSLSETPDKAWRTTVDIAPKVIEKYNRFASRVEELGLQEDVDAKPILDVSPFIVNVPSQSPDITP
jgi:tRNA nucleotidyltransferase (CCA-adding enzyme)